MTRAIPVTCTGAGTIQIELLTGLQGNLKTISRKNLEKLKNSILEDGIIDTLVIWKKGKKRFIVDGHQRVRALLELQAEGYVIPPLPCTYIDAANFEDAKKKLLRISSAYGQITTDGLLEFTAQMTMPSDLCLPSGELRIETLRPSEDEAGDDDAPESAPKIARRGDLWEMNDHRLVVGDATSKDDWQALMGEQRAQLIFTDPPYGIDYDSRGEQKDLGGIMGDEKEGLELERKLLAPAFRMAAKYSLEDAAFYIWHASSTRSAFERAMTAAGLREHQYLLWVKPWIVMGRGQYHYQHEPCFYAAKGQATPRWTGDRTQSSVWTASLRSYEASFVVLAEGLLLGDGKGNQVYIAQQPPKGKKHRSIQIAAGETVNISTLEGTDIWQVAPDSKTEYIHPNQKPVELALRAIANNTEPGEVVLDCFAGSGSTLIAAQRSSRVARLMELDPRFADLILKRWCLWMQRHNLTPEVKRNGKDYDWQKIVPDEE